MREKEAGRDKEPLNLNKFRPVILYKNGNFEKFRLSERKGERAKTWNIFLIFCLARNFFYIPLSAIISCKYFQLENLQRIFKLFVINYKNLSSVYSGNYFKILLRFLEINNSLSPIQYDLQEKWNILLALPDLELQINLATLNPATCTLFSSSWNKPLHGHGNITCTKNSIALASEETSQKYYKSSSTTELESNDNSTKLAVSYSIQNGISLKEVFNVVAINDI